MKPRRRRRVESAPALVLLALVVSSATPVLASGLFGHVFAKPHAQAAPSSDKADAVADQIQLALDERRYVDAADLFEKAEVAKITSPRLIALDGELLLAKGQFTNALMMFRSVANDPGEKARAMEGEGLAQSLLGKTDQALIALQQATALDKSLWRAWNGLGREYDMRKDWKKSQAAYASALADADSAGARAIVLNNRGYSHMLQNEPGPAAADFVAALDKDSMLAAARTNLRIAMAMEGHYDSAVMSGPGEDRAAVLNNVGLAAAIRGDYTVASKLLNQAIEAKGAYYERASDNLQLTKQLQARAQEPSNSPNAAP